MFGGSSMVAPDSSWGGGQIDVSSNAVTSRNVHSATYDALRLCVAL